MSVALLTPSMPERRLTPRSPRSVGPTLRFDRNCSTTRSFAREGTRAGGRPRCCEQQFRMGDGSRVATAAWRSHSPNSVRESALVAPGRAGKDAAHHCGRERAHRGLPHAGSERCLPGDPKRREAGGVRDGIGAAKSQARPAGANLSTLAAGHCPRFALVFWPRTGRPHGAVRGLLLRPHGHGLGPARSGRQPGDAGRCEAAAGALPSPAPLPRGRRCRWCARRRLSVPREAERCPWRAPSQTRRRPASPPAVRARARPSSEPRPPCLPVREGQPGGGGRSRLYRALQASPPTPPSSNNAAPQHCQTPLILAAWQGHTALAVALVKRGAKINALSSVSQRPDAGTVPANTLRHATPRHVSPRHATPRHATPRHATARGRQHRAAPAAMAAASEANVLPRPAALPIPTRRRRTG